MLSFLLRSFTGRLIIDADGLTILSKADRSEIRAAACDIVLTPHIKEFSRLTGLAIPEILSRPLDSALEYVRDIEGKTERVLLLKGPSTIITDGKETYLTDTGCPGMATAGSGDVLSGILSATCAYIPELTAGVAVAAWINGRAGQLAEKESGAVSMTAGDTAAHIPEVLREALD